MNDVTRAGAVVLTAATMLLAARPARAAQPPTPALEAAEEAKPTTKPTGAEALNQLLQKKMPEVRFDAIGLSDVVDFLRDVTGANIAVDWRGLAAAGVKESTPVSARLRDVPFQKALDVILADADGGKKLLTTVTRDNILVILPAKDAAARQARWAAHDKHPAAGGVQQLLDARLPEVRFDKTPFGDVVDFLRDISAANLFVAWKPLEEAGVSKKTSVSMKLKDARLGDVLLVLLDDLPAKRELDYTVDQNVIQIAPAAEQKPAK